MSSRVLESHDSVAQSTSTSPTQDRGIGTRLLSSMRHRDVSSTSKKLTSIDKREALLTQRREAYLAYKRGERKMSIEVMRGATVRDIDFARVDEERARERRKLSGLQASIAGSEAEDAHGEGFEWLSRNKKDSLKLAYNVYTKAAKFILSPIRIARRITDPIAQTVVNSRENTSIRKVMETNDDTGNTTLRYGMQRRVETLRATRTALDSDNRTADDVKKDLVIAKRQLAADEGELADIEADLVQEMSDELSEKRQFAYRARRESQRQVALLNRESRALDVSLNGETTFGDAGTRQVATFALSQHQKRGADRLRKRGEGLLDALSELSYSKFTAAVQEAGVAEEHGLPHEVKGNILSSIWASGIRRASNWAEQRSERKRQEYAALKETSGKLKRTFSAFSHWTGSMTSRVLKSLDTQVDRSMTAEETLDGMSAIAYSTRNLILGSLSFFMVERAAELAEFEIEAAQSGNFVGTHTEVVSRVQQQMTQVASSLKGDMHSLREGLSDTELTAVKRAPDIIQQASILSSSIITEATDVVQSGGGGSHGMYSGPRTPFHYDLGGGDEPVDFGPADGDDEPADFGPADGEVVIEPLHTQSHIMKYDGLSLSGVLDKEFGLKPYATLNLEYNAEVLSLANTGGINHGDEIQLMPGNQLRVLRNGEIIAGKTLIDFSEGSEGGEPSGDDAPPVSDDASEHEGEKDLETAPESPQAQLIMIHEVQPGENLSQIMDHFEHHSWIKLEQNSAVYTYSLEGNLEAGDKLHISTSSKLLWVERDGDVVVGTSEELPIQGSEQGSESDPLVLGEEAQVLQDELLTLIESKKELIDALEISDSDKDILCDYLEGMEQDLRAFPEDRLLKYTTEEYTQMMDGYFSQYFPEQDSNFVTDCDDEGAQDPVASGEAVEDDSSDEDASGDDCEVDSQDEGDDSLEPEKEPVRTKTIAETPTFKDNLSKLRDAVGTVGTRKDFLRLYPHMNHVGELERLIGEPDTIAEFLKEVFQDDGVVEDVRIREILGRDRFKLLEASELQVIREELQIAVDQISLPNDLSIDEAHDILGRSTKPIKVGGMDVESGSLSYQNLMIVSQFDGDDILDHAPTKRGKAMAFRWDSRHVTSAELDEGIRLHNSGVEDFELRTTEHVVFRSIERICDGDTTRASNLYQYLYFRGSGDSSTPVDVAHLMQHPDQVAVVKQGIANILINHDLLEHDQQLMDAVTSGNLQLELVDITPDQLLSGDEVTSLYNSFTSNNALTDQEMTYTSIIGGGEERRYNALRSIIDGFQKAQVREGFGIAGVGAEWDPTDSRFGAHATAAVTSHGGGFASAGVDYDLYQGKANGGRTDITGYAGASTVGPYAGVGSSTNIGPGELNASVAATLHGGLGGGAEFKMHLDSIMNKVEARFTPEAVNTRLEQVLSTQGGELSTKEIEAVTNRVGLEVFNELVRSEVRGYDFAGAGVVIGYDPSSGNGGAGFFVRLRVHGSENVAFPIETTIPDFAEHGDVDIFHTRTSTHQPVTIHPGDLHTVESSVDVGEEFESTRNHEYEWMDEYNETLRDMKSGFELAVVSDAPNTYVLQPLDGAASYDLDRFSMLEVHGVNNVEVTTLNGRILITVPEGVVPGIAFDQVSSLAPETSGHTYVNRVIISDHMEDNSVISSQRVRVFPGKESTVMYTQAGTYALGDIQALYGEEIREWEDPIQSGPQGDLLFDHSASVHEMTEEFRPVNRTSSAEQYFKANLGEGLTTLQMRELGFSDEQAHYLNSTLFEHMKALDTDGEGTFFEDVLSDRHRLPTGSRFSSALGRGDVARFMSTIVPEGAPLELSAVHTLDPTDSVERDLYCRFVEAIPVEDFELKADALKEILNDERIFMRSSAHEIAQDLRNAVLNGDKSFEREGLIFDIDLPEIVVGLYNADHTGTGETCMNFSVNTNWDFEVRGETTIGSQSRDSFAKIFGRTRLEQKYGLLATSDSRDGLIPILGYAVEGSKGGAPGGPDDCPKCDDGGGGPDE